MPSLDEKAKRAERARQNGAKSKGPATPEGLNRARTASIQHGLYATPDTLRHMVDPVVYEEFRRGIQALWNPDNLHVSTRVNHLVSLMWEMDRLIGSRREYMEEMFSFSGTSVSDMEVHVSRKGDILERIDFRLRKLNLEISRIERDLLHLQKHFVPKGPSQKPLKTNATPGFPLEPCYQEGPTPGNSPVNQAPLGGPEVPNMPDTAPRG